MESPSTESKRPTFDPGEVVELLGRTPTVLAAMLAGLPDELARATEGPGTWSPFDVVGHLIHGERTDWIPRARHILDEVTAPFDVFDRTAQFEASANRTLVELLEEFTVLRRESLVTLEAMRLERKDFERTGLHPELGIVTFAQLLTTWVVHDLDHVGQIARTLAKRYATDVGPWSAYLSILRDRT